LKPIFANSNTRPFAKTQSTQGEADLQPARIYSDLSGLFIQGEVACDVQIFRFAHEQIWNMEINKGDSPTSRWRKTFATDGEAWDAFMHSVEGFR
jgi:hypothetical protein